MSKVLFQAWLPLLMVLQSPNTPL